MSSKFLPSALISSLYVAVSPLCAQGLHDLLKPDLDQVRQETEERRRAERAELEKQRQEEEALRLEEEKRQAALARAKADPLVDVNQVSLVDSDIDGQAEYKIAPGGTLGAIAAERYGSSQYFPIIEVWNGVSANKVFVGQKIKTPSVATIVRVKGEKVLARYPEEVAALVSIREEYQALEDELRQQVTAKSVTPEMTSKLQALYEKAKRMHAGFLVKRPGVENYATSLLSQCKGVVEQFAAMRNGDFGRNNSRLTRVHTRLGYAISYAITWGEEGFK